MRIGLIRIIVATALAVALGAPDGADAAKKRTAAGPLKAGAATADITPPIGAPMFAYTDRSRVFNPTNNQDLLQVLADPDEHLYAKTFTPSKGFHTRLRSRALVIERLGVPYALVQVDLGGIPFAVAKAVAERVAPLGITQDRLLISATHTHAGHGAIWPNLDNLGYGFVGGDVFDKRIFDLTVAGIAESIEAAHAKRQAARIGIAQTQVFDAPRNRASEQFALNPEASRAGFAPQDPDLTVIRLDTPTRRPIAVWSNFAIHPTTIGDPVLSSENAGATNRIVEAALGKGAVNVWTNGNEGDISPDGGADRLGGEPAQYVSGPFAGSAMAGTKVARGVIRAWEQAGEDMRSDIALAAVQGYLPFDGTAAGETPEPVGPIPVLGNGGIVAPDGTCAPVENMSGPGQGAKLFLAGGPIVPTVAPVSILRVGDLGIVTTPSEVTRTMGARIRDGVRAASGGAFGRVITAGLTDGYLSYTSTPEEYEACHYEASFTLFGRQQGPRYRDYASALSAHLTTGAPAPAGAAEPLQTALGAEQDVTFKDTPNAGTAVAQPAGVVRRFERARFRWNGGDRALEAQRGKAWVSLQRRVDGEWETVSTDDALADLTMRVGPELYEETYSFGPCDPLGTYRFQITGRARRNGVTAPYTLNSQSFELRRATLSASPVTVADGVATFRVRYPDPGPDTIIPLARLVTKGTALLEAAGEKVKARPDAKSGTFTARLPAGTSATVLSAADDCGNTTG